MMQTLYPADPDSRVTAGPRTARSDESPAPSCGRGASLSVPLMPAIHAPLVIAVRTSRGQMTNYNYVVVDAPGGHCVLVDPAWEIDRYRQAMADARATLAGVLLTHAHADHVDLAGTLATEYGCPVWMSAEEIAASGFEAPGLVAIDETPWHAGQLRIEPFLTPGHTPGSVCYRIGENLFTGDVLFAEGCGLCADADSAYRMHESLERLKRTLSPATRIFPGHSFGSPPGRRFEEVLQENIYLHFRDRDRFAAFRLRGGQDRSRQFDFR